MPNKGLTRSALLHGRLRVGLTTIVLFLGGSAIGRTVPLQSLGLQALWVANAAVFGYMICRGRYRGELATIIGIGMASALATQLHLGSPAIIVLLFPIANGLQWALAYWLLRRVWRGGALLDHPRNVVALVAAAFGALVVTSHACALSMTVAYDAPYWRTYAAALAAGALGSMLVSPAIVVVAELAARRRTLSLGLWGWCEMAGLLALVGGVTGYVFFVSRLPTTFLIVPAVLLATFRFRAVGAVAATIIVAAVSGYATATSQGAIAYLIGDPANRVLMLQVFLAATFAAALPVAAMLTERDLHATEARMIADQFRQVVENIGEVIFRIDGDGCWAYLNPAWPVLTGVPVAHSIGRPWTERLVEEDKAALVADVASVLAGKSEGLRRALRLHATDRPRWVELFVQGLRDADGRVVGATGTLRDIDDRKRLEENVVSAKRRAEQRAREAHLLASTDELTGIANRRAFLRQLDREIASAAEFGWPLALAMFDVDHFKQVNDRHGHAVGDRVLQQIAIRAAGVVRGGDLVGRLGGEEFAILMPGASAIDAAHVAERLREAMQLPSEDCLPVVTVSVGIASREGQRDAAALLATADSALYAAKDAGRNQVRIAA